MSKVKSVLFRILALFLGVVHAIVLIGFALQGAFNAVTAKTTLGVIYGLVFMVLGGLFTYIVYKEFVPLILPKGLSVAAKFVNSNKKKLLATLVIMLILIIFQRQLFFTLLYGGFVFTGFVLNQAKLGILRIVPLDILTLRFDLVQWLGQAYYIHLILGWIPLKKKKHRVVRGS